LLSEFRRSCFGRRQNYSEVGEAADGAAGEEAAVEAVGAAASAAAPGRAAVARDLAAALDRVVDIPAVQGDPAAIALPPLVRPAEAEAAQH
jgi:hypothetical protein